MILLGVDIGGTKTIAGLVGDGFLVSELSERPTQKGVSGFQGMLGEILETYKELLDAHGVTHLGIALPGCLEGADGSVIRPGTGLQLGQYPGEFDGRDLLEILAQVSQDLSVTLINDAQAQCLGGVRQLGIVGGPVGYIGPGTGLGGGFCEVRSGVPTLRTDGHIFDCAVTHPLTGEAVYAESILSGRGITETWGILPQDLNTDHGVATHAAIIAALASVYVQLIQQFREGSVTHLSGESDWSADDRAWVRTVRTYMIGAGLGTKPPLANRIKDLAQASLGSEVQLLFIPDVRSAPLLGLQYRVSGIA